MSNVNEINEIVELELNTLSEVESTQSTITNESDESILTPEFITFDDLKSQFEQKIPINQILNIKSYLPIMYKSVLINNIISSAKEIDDNGMTRINYTNLELYKLIFMIENFTNYAFNPETMIEEVDYIIENKIVELIDKEIGNSQLWNIENLLSKELEQVVKVDNSIENVINTHMYLFQDKIETLLEKIPDFKEDTVNKWVKSLSKTLKSFDPSKMEMVQSILDLNKSK